jgi:hypothetical protein
MSSANTEKSALFQPFCLLFLLFRLIELVRTSCRTLNKSDDGGNLTFYQSYGENIQTFAIKYEVSCRLLKEVLYQVEEFPFETECDGIHL